jgi:tetratricopeptide (TPR) repeat protein
MEPRSDKRNEIIAIIIIVAAVLIAIAYFFSHTSSPSAPAGTASSTATSATSTSAVSSSTMVTVTSAPSSAGYTIKLLPAGKAPTAPDYKAPLTFSASVPADQQASMQAQFMQVQAALAQNNQDFNAWIELGDLHKEAGDYDGAAADWQYMSALYPSNIVSNANLADLYTNYLMNYPKAAAAYKAAIANNPTEVYLYQDLFSLYTNQYPQPTTTIEALLNQGLSANPSAAELKVDLTKI